MVNCSRGEAASMTLPRELAAVDWGTLDFLGWRDPKAPLRGYLVVWRDGKAVGVQLRAAESKMSGRVAAMCSLCRTGQPASNVSLFVARRTGQAGRNGNTVGTYICADLVCCRNVRLDKPSATLHPDPGLTIDERVERLRTRTDSFIDEVLSTVG
ncbi:hypothetical protein Raf01_54270 [Rugosimonospora africana]|uniref:Elongation factor G-binding protein C-terminal treble-clef zinc-finger domain-containing protein n=2 Tax=Rugosimonospora africana TaxID=556532 RepID=A0A8J3QWX1_9ACTN|nr:hypothetical protein Raf01_54270 [Rugosimonospora africana]